MKLIKYCLLILTIPYFCFCDSSSKTEEIVILSDHDPIDSVNVKRTEDIEKIYFNVPSPMETAIILKKAGAVYDFNLPLSPEKAQESFSREEQAVVLGMYGADLNYTIVSNENQETMFYLNSTNIIGEKLGLGSILNDNVKKRVDKNIDSKDSMQVIIGDLFWKVESSLKEDGRGSISALVVAGGWIEGLYISTQLSDQMPENKEFKTLICEQKFSIGNLVTLLDSYEFSDHTIDILINPIIELNSFFNKIEEKIEPYENDNTESKTPVIGENIKLILDQEIIDKIRLSVEHIRSDITH